MNTVLCIWIAMLALYGFYSALREIRAMLMKLGEKKNNCAKKAQNRLTKKGKSDII